MTMLNIEIHRYGFGLNSTLGRVSLERRGEVFECFSLEDERRRVKVAGETCIPPGTYEVKLRTEGGLHSKYSDRFPETHRGMLWLQDVPNFQWVYIHIGNKERHTDGCPLVGEVPVILPDGEFEIARSEAAYLKLYSIVTEAMDAGERVVAHITEDTREGLGA